MTTGLGQRLARARKQAELNQKDVAQQFGISSQAISQWESERTRPDSLKLAKLARLFHVRLEWLLDGSGPMHSEGPSPATEVRHTARVPVIDRVEAGDWTEVEDPFVVGSADEFLQTDLEVSSSTFALVIQGRSMEPEFQPGDKVIIDPKIEPRPGDFVVAKRDNDQGATFKKYRPRSLDEKGREVIELTPVNPDWPALMIDQDNPGHIVGTMVEHRRYRRG